MNCSPWLHEASYNRLGFYIWPSTQGPWTVKLLMSNVLIYWAICDTLSIFELFWVIIFKNTYHFIWHICLPNQLFWIIDFSKHLYFAAIVNSDSPLYLYSDTRTGRGFVDLSTLFSNHLKWILWHIPILGQYAW